MKKFIVEEDFIKVFNDFKIGVLVFEGIDNNIVDENKYQPLLKEATKQAKQYLTKDNFCENDIVQEWRIAFQQFKTKKGARSSIEALLKRVDNDKELNSINPLVDIYNAISLKYGLPCGGEDIDKFVGNLRLTKAVGGEDFITLGVQESEPALAQEIIYKDDVGAVCRCFNWREAIRTMLSEQTTNAILIIETINQNKQDKLNKAIDELASLVQSNLGGTYKKYLLDKNNNEIIIK